MKKLVSLLAVAILTMAAGSAFAVPLDPNLVRPVTPNPAAPGENSLQTELNSIFGAGVVNAATDQLKVGMFQVGLPGSNSINPQFKFEWTSNSGSQTIGIFGWNGTFAVTSQIFAGSQGAGDTAIVTWLTSSSGTINSFDNGSLVSSIAFSDISKDFFGFYFQVGNIKYYTVDSLNDGQARVLGFQPNLLGAVFAYEDGSDFDYQDAGFLVESIRPASEPVTLILLGSGLLGLAAIRRKK